MSSSQVYPTLTTTIDPSQMGTDATSGVAVGEWYPHGPYPFDPPYMTPYPPSTVEGQPWTTPYSRASVPNIQLGTYDIHHPPHQSHQPHPQQHVATTKDPSRPKSSSPCNPGPSAGSSSWPLGLGIVYTPPGGHPTPPVTSTFPPSVFQYARDDGYVPSGTPEQRQPQQRRSYAPIAPNPEGLAAERKRKRDDNDQNEATSANAKQRKRTSSVGSADLNDEDRFLVQLKEDELLPWKEIATRFQTDKGKSFQVAALQMRYKRLREKFRVWEETDVNALKLAYEYWEKYKWEIISAKMLDFNVQERWPVRYCARKWQELEAAATVVTATHVNPTTTAPGMTPVSISQFSSPVETPVHFAFMPIQ